MADLFAPVSGKVIEINETLEDNPEFVNSDPYVNGWIVKVSISDISEMEELMSADKYEELIK